MNENFLKTNEISMNDNVRDVVLPPIVQVIKVVKSKKPQIVDKQTLTQTQTNNNLHLQQNSIFLRRKNDISDHMMSPATTNNDILVNNSNQNNNNNQKIHLISNIFFASTTANSVTQTLNNNSNSNSNSFNDNHCENTNSATILKQIPTLVKIVKKSNEGHSDHLVQGGNTTDDMQPIETNIVENNNNNTNHYHSINLSTLEQLREFDLVLEQVKVRSNVKVDDEDDNDNDNDNNLSPVTDELVVSASDINQTESVIKNHTDLSNNNNNGTLTLPSLPQQKVVTATPIMVAVTNYCANLRPTFAITNNLVSFGNNQPISINNQKLLTPFINVAKCSTTKSVNSMRNLHVFQQSASSGLQGHFTTSKVFTVSTNTISTSTSTSTSMSTSTCTTTTATTITSTNNVDTAVNNVVIATTTITSTSGTINLSSVLSQSSASSATNITNSLSPQVSPITSLANNTTKVPPVPKQQQKPQEDEHTMQRIYDILAEYAEQLRNSPDLNNKPAPRRRSNPPTTMTTTNSNGGSSATVATLPTTASNSTTNSLTKRKKSSQPNGKKSNNSPDQQDEHQISFSEDSSNGTIHSITMDSTSQNASDQNLDDIVCSTSVYVSGPGSGSGSGSGLESISQLTSTTATSTSTITTTSTLSSLSCPIVVTTTASPTTLVKPLVTTTNNRQILLSETNNNYNHTNPNPNPNPNPNLNPNTNNNSGSATTALLVPGNYLIPMSMMKSGQQIAVVATNGNKLLAATIPQSTTANPKIHQPIQNGRNYQNTVILQNILNNNSKSIPNSSTIFNSRNASTVVLPTSVALALSNNVNKDRQFQQQQQQQRSKIFAIQKMVSPTQLLSQHNSAILNSNQKLTQSLNCNSNNNNNDLNSEKNANLVTGKTELSINCSLADERVLQDDGGEDDYDDDDEDCEQVNYQEGNLLHRNKQCKRKLSFLDDVSSDCPSTTSSVIQSSHGHFTNSNATTQTKFFLVRDKRNLLQQSIIKNRNLANNKIIGINQDYFCGEKDSKIEAQRIISINNSEEGPSCEVDETASLSSRNNDEFHGDLGEDNLNSAELFPGIFE